MRTPSRPLRISSECLCNGTLLPHQHEAAQYIRDCLQTRDAFLLADGTGTGKTRTASAVGIDFLREGIAANEERLIVWFAANQLLADSAAKEAAQIEPCGKSIEPWRAARNPAGNTIYTTYMSMCNVKKRDALLLRLQRTSAVLFIFDESHVLRYKGQTCAATQDVLMRTASGRVVKHIYLSASAASDSSHLQYLQRLFDGDEMAALREGTGIALLEAATLELKRRGQFLSRQLTPPVCSIQLRTVPLLHKDQQLYDQICTALRDAQATLGNMHHRLYINLLSLIKAPAVAALAQEEVRAGRSVVICLQLTGSAWRRRAVQSSENIRNSVSEYLLSTFPAIAARLHHLLSARRDMIETVRAAFPPELLVDLTAASSPGDMRAMIQRFQNDEVVVAIASRAAALGTSLHAMLPTSRPRTLIVAECPWTSETFVQQCGRVFRIGATSAPSYIFVRSELPAEQRLFQTLQMRLRAMSAISYADRVSDHDVGGTLRRSYSEIDSGMRRAVVVELTFKRCVALFGETLASRQVSASNYVAQHRYRGSQLQSTVSTFLYSKCATWTDAKDVEILGLHAWPAAIFLAYCDWLLSEAVLWRARSWSPELHFLTRPCFRESVRIILLDATRPQGTFSCLPRALLLDVINLACDDVTPPERTASLLGALAQTTTLRRMATCNTEAFLNIFFCLNVSQQNELRGVLERQQSYSAQQRLSANMPQNARTIREYILRKMDACSFSVVCEDFSDAADDERGTRRLMLRVQRVSQTAPEFDGFASIHGLPYGVQVQADGSRRIFKPLQTFASDSISTAAMHSMQLNGTWEDVPSAPFRAVETKLYQRQQRLANARSGIYVFLLRRMLSGYATSMRTLLLVDRSCGWQGQPFVALLQSRPVSFRA